MLRRVARAFRVALMFAGLLLVLWAGISFYVGATLWVPLTGDSHFWIYADTGSAHAGIQRLPAWIAGIDLMLFDPEPERRSWATITDVGYFRSQHGVGYVVIPLWLLAAICLAWPVTSFILHRRRHKRGFPIEANSGPPLPPGEGVTQLAEGERSDG